MSEAYRLRSEHLVTGADELRALYPPTHRLAAIKSLPHLDAHARDFLARAPFLCIGTQTADGRADVSPRGDPCGFVKVLDDRTLLIPDRPGNNRLDTLVNILANPSVGLLFLIPGFDETLRINGKACITRDPDLLARLAVRDRPALAGILVQVDEVFLHCAKALRRSRLWDASQHQDRRSMPSLMKMLLDQTEGAPAAPEDIAALDEGLEEVYRSSMY
jgi:uncharacterized protein